MLTVAVTEFCTLGSVLLLLWRCSGFGVARRRVRFETLSGWVRDDT